MDYGDPGRRRGRAALGSGRHRHRHVGRRSQRHRHRGHLGRGQRPGQPGRPGRGARRRQHGPDHGGRYGPVQHLVVHRVGLGPRITDKSVNRTIVSKDGTRTSGFFLNYVSSLDRWAFYQDNGRQRQLERAAGHLRRRAGARPVDPSDRRLRHRRRRGQALRQRGAAVDHRGDRRLERHRRLRDRPCQVGRRRHQRVGGKHRRRPDLRLGAERRPGVGPGRRPRTAGACYGYAGPRSSRGPSDQTDGEVATNLVYHPPLGKAAGGPYDLTGTAVASIGRRATYRPTRPQSSSRTHRPLATAPRRPSRAQPATRSPPLSLYLNARR